MQQKWSIGVDLGGTKIEAALVNSQGHIEKKLRVLTDVAAGPEGIAKQIIKLTKELERGAPSKFCGIGIGVPGQIEADTQMVRFAPNLKWKNVDLKKQLSTKTDLPIFLDNDVRVATRGEWLFGAGKGINNFVALFLGTGIGGGIVANGQLMTGCTNSAGELGHMTVLMGGPLCTCGNRGCLEALAGGWGIAKQAQEMVQKDVKKGTRLLNLVNGNLDKITAVEVSKALNVQDPIAVEVTKQAVAALIAGCTTIVNGLNPELLIFGGGLLKGFPQFLPEVDRGVREHALSAALPKLKIVASSLENASLLGSASLAFCH